MGFRNQQKTILLLSLLLTISLFTLKSTLAESDDEEFIKKSCKESPNRDLCYTSLSPFASQVKNSYEKLAAVSINLCLLKVEPLRAHVQDLAKRARKPPILKQALEQCIENFDATIDDIKECIKLMKDPKAPGAKGNLRSWMSAAVADASACQDAMTEIPVGPEEKDVLNQTNALMDIIGISLTMIHLFVES